MASQDFKGPPPADTTELHLKLVKRFDVIGPGPRLSYVNHLAVADSLGITFIGAENGFLVVRTDSVGAEDVHKRFVPVNCLVTHLAVNSDDTLLAVGVILPDKTCAALVYALNHLTEGRLSDPQNVMLSSRPLVALTDLIWNPTVPQMMSACLTDGCVVMVELKGSSMEVNSLPPTSGARCLCWSPKGKQLVVGSEDGKLIQYRPDLKPFKALPAPNALGGEATVVNVLWISNFQFGAFYRNRNDHQSTPVLFIINAEKNQPVTFIKYEDALIYSLAEFRPHQFYFHHLTAWNLILISSSNSVDLAVLSTEPGGNVWRQIISGDSSRAEMPLSATNDETFPYGMSIDMSNQSSIPWGEGAVSPMPRLLTLSNEGRLSLYNVINLRSDVGPVCNPPSAILPHSFFDQPKNIQNVPALIQPPAPASITPQLHETPPVSPNVPKNIPPTPEPEASAVASSLSQEVEAIIEPTPEPQPPPEPVVDDSIFEAAIAEEIIAMNDEFLNFRSSLGPPSLKLGALEELSDAVRRLDNLTEFESDVSETTTSQAEEVSEIRLDVLELVARADETSLLNKRRHNQLLSELHRGEPLDPVTSRMTKETLTLKTYVESQIHLVKDHLERQWEEYQKSCRKDAKKFMTTPFMEQIFKTLDIHKKLVCHQKATIEQLARELQCTRLTPHQPTAPASLNRSQEMSNLTERFDSLNMKRGEKIKSDAILLLEKKMEDAKLCELSAVQLTMLLDRFDDAEVPQVSNILRYSEREIQKKQIAERIKKATASAKKKREQAEKEKVTVPLPKMTPVSFGPDKTSPVVSSFPTKQLEVKPLVHDMVSSSSSIFSPVVAQGDKMKPSTGNSSAPTFSFSSSSNNKTSAFTTFTPSGFGGVTVSSISTSSGLSHSASSFTAIAKPSAGLTMASATPTTSSAFAFGTSSPQTIGMTGFSFNIGTSAAASSKATIDITKTNSSVSVFTSSAPAQPTKFDQFSFSVGSSSMAFEKPSPTPPTTTSEKKITFTASPSAAAESKPLTTPTMTLSFGTKATPQLGSSLFSSVTDAKPSKPSSDNVGSAAGEVKLATTTSTFTAVQPPSTTSSGLFKSIPDQAIDTKIRSNTPTSEASSLLAASASPKSSKNADNTSPTIAPALSASEAADSSSESKAVTTSEKFGVNSPLVTAVAPTTNAFFSSLPSPSSPLTLFGGTPSNTASSFGPAATTTAPSSLFAALATTTSSTFANTTSLSANVFGSTPTQAAPSAFGSTDSGSVFGNVPSTTTTTGLFGLPTQTVPSPGLFGSTPIAPNVFSGSETKTTTSIFGSSFNQPNVSSGSVFSSPQTPQNQFGSDLSQTTNLFGQVLGGAATPASTPQTNIFGQVTPTKPAFESGTNIFGVNASPASTSASIFGSSSASVFGQSPFASPTTSSGIFGQAPAATGTASMFGASTFGSGTPTSNQNLFGGTASPNAFGASAFGAKPMIGQSIFGQSNTQSTFGAGSQPAASSASIFGGSSGGAFSSGAFSGGAFSGSSASPTSSPGFGTPSVFSKAGTGFGSAPVFGGAPPAFGTSAGFGSAPVFGGQKVFGSPSSAGTFGQPQQPTAFEAMADQNTVGFGNLAQMAGQQTGFSAGGFSGNQTNAFGTQPQPQQSASFGGSSFSSWR